MKKIASNDNYIIVDSSYCQSKCGLVVSFAFPLFANEISVITELGNMFEEYVKKNFGKVLSKHFFSKTVTPVLFSKGEEMFMVWSFVAKDDKKALKQLKKLKVKEVEYE